jgi:spiro-SPASM protein
MEKEAFKKLLDKIIAFSGDAVIDLSLWGELAIHPGKMDIIGAVLSRPELALIIETSGIGWRSDELEKTLELSKAAAAKAGRISPLPPLSWIVSLDTMDPAHYRELRGPGFTEAVDCAKRLLTLFPKNAYVQAVRTKGDEDDIEKFYRTWKEAAANIIIQKYDDFCGALPKRQASDISPVERQPCWHIMRDFPVLLDGTVPRCKEDSAALGNDNGCTLGNALTEQFEDIWKKGAACYDTQCRSVYEGICAGCDEYYTYNF